MFEGARALDYGLGLSKGLRGDCSCKEKMPTRATVNREHSSANPKYEK